MLNQSIVVGRIKEKRGIKELENGKKLSFITLTVPRSYKNVNGEYENDYIDCALWDSIAKDIDESCKVGDIVGIRGRLQRSEDDYAMMVIADKVTLLSRKDEKNE